MVIRLVYCLQLYRLVFKMNGADSEPSHKHDRILVTIANKLE